MKLDIEEVVSLSPEEAPLQLHPNELKEKSEMTMIFSPSVRQLMRIEIAEVKAKLPQIQ